MTNNIKKSSFFFLFTIIIVIIPLLFIQLLNFFFSSPPRYNELVFNLDEGDIRYKKEKLVFYKSKKFFNELKYLNVNSNDYRLLNYSGYLVNRNCGSLESGKTELFYITDKNGFRENIDTLYDKTDYILLGDSFTESICVNKPNDLKSNLQKINQNIKYLNLGRQGTDYSQQLNILLKVTKNTEFKNLIWFFYEGNDYETKLKDLNLFEFNKTTDNFRFQYQDRDLNKINYNLFNDFDINLSYKIRVFLAEALSGIGFFAKYFKTYPQLIDEEDYDDALKIANNYLKNKKVRNKVIYYIPSWQRLSNYKSRKFSFYLSNPQIKQLDHLKKTIKEISEKNDFKFIDGEDLFLNLNDPLEVFHYRLNTHFNNKGYKYLAEDLYKKIYLKHNE